MGEGSGPTGALLSAKRFTSRAPPSTLTEPTHTQTHIYVHVGRRGGGEPHKRTLLFLADPKCLAQIKVCHQETHLCTHS